MNGLINPPAELKSLKQWHCWQLNGDVKIPVQVNGVAAKSNDPGTWTDFETALAYSTNYSGLAWVFSEVDPYCGVDLDGCLDDAGHLKDWALPVIARFDGVAFMEISPSQTGIKLITRAVKKVERCLHKIGPKQQIECYDRARYWTITGQIYSRQIEIGDGQAAVDWLCQTYLQQDKPKPRPVVRVCTGTSLEQRAADYVDSVPPQLEGNRNNAAFNLAGHLAALEDNGQRLSEDQVRGFIEQWNQGLTNPLPAKEIKSAVSSALRNGTPRAVKPANEIPIVTAYPEVDLTRLLNNLLEPDESAEIPQALIDDAPGLIGDVYRWLVATSMYVLPEVFLASSLALVGTITGRKVRDFTNNRTNVFVMAIAPTSSGKEHARSQIKELLIEAGGEDLLGPEDLASASGLTSQLNEHPCSLFQLDEFGRLLEQVNADRAPSHLREIVTQLLRLYSGAGSRKWIGKGYADRGKVPRINQPHCVLNATTTPGSLWESMTNRQVHDGLLGRMQIFEAADYVPLKNRIPERGDVPDHLVDQVRWWLEKAPGAGNLSAVNPQPIDVQHSREARQRYENHVREIADKRIGEDTLTAAIWSRSAEKAGKLALIAACADRQLQITEDHIEWGIALQNALTRKLLIRLRENVSDNEAERMKKRVLKIVRQRDRMTLSELTRRTQFLKDRRHRMTILEELEDAGFVKRWKEGESSKLPILISGHSSKWPVDIEVDFNESDSGSE